MIVSSSDTDSWHGDIDSEAQIIDFKLTGYTDQARSNELTADTQVDLGNAVYYSTESESDLSSLLDWRITGCTAAEQVTVTDDDITTSGRTFDLIKVSQNFRT